MNTQSPSKCNINVFEQNVIFIIQKHYMQHVFYSSLLD